jgi:hypothetical protein
VIFNDHVWHNQERQEMPCSHLCSVSMDSELPTLVINWIYLQKTSWLAQRPIWKSTGLPRYLLLTYSIEISFGTTWFSTFVDQSSSVSHCLLAMEKCYSEGLLVFNTKAVHLVLKLRQFLLMDHWTKPLQKYFMTDSPEQLQLWAQLYNINMLLKPIACGLKTLESTQVTCSDVFTIWIGIATGF